MAALIVVALGVPWWATMHFRHGRIFLDRLLVKHHLQRVGVGVHGDDGSIAYFIGQLGYACFPWVAFIPAAMFWALRYPKDRAEDPRGQGQALRMLALWSVGSFTLFSAMGTKFHHYIFPVVPPLAVLVGLYLDRVLGK